MCPEMSQSARQHERYMLGACIAMDKALERPWGFRVPITALKGFLATKMVKGNHKNADIHGFLRIVVDFRYNVNPGLINP